MALVDHVEFDAFVVAIGDGETPEVFSPKCTINASRGFSLSAEANTRNIPDCEDDKLPSATLRYVSSYSGEISGSGMLEKTDEKFFADWLISGAKKNCKVSVGGAGGTMYAFAGVLTSFSITAERFGTVEAEITIESHGAITTSVIS